MSKKTNKKTEIAPIFAPEFAKAVRTVLDKKCKQGDAVPRTKIVNALLRGEGGVKFGIRHREMLKVLVSLVVQESEVEGTYSAETLRDIEGTRGRSGGYYNAKQREEWNAAVEAGQVA